MYLSLLTICFHFPNYLDHLLSRENDLFYFPLSVKEAKTPPSSSIRRNQSIIALVTQLLQITFPFILQLSHVRRKVFSWNRTTNSNQHKPFYNPLARTVGFMWLFFSRFPNIYPSLQSEHLPPIKPETTEQGRGARTTFTVWLLWTRHPSRATKLCSSCLLLATLFGLTSLSPEEGSMQMMSKLPGTEGDEVRGCVFKLQRISQTHTKWNKFYHS